MSNESVIGGTKRILIYFSRNPGEELTARDMSTKFGISNPHTIVKHDVASGLLSRRKANGQVYYGAGPELINLITKGQTCEEATLGT